MDRRTWEWDNLKWPLYVWHFLFKGAKHKRNDGARDLVGNIFANLRHREPNVLLVDISMKIILMKVI